MIIISSCEDAPPSEYIPKIFVEAYLIVGEPIQNIIIMSTQPVQDSFKYSNSLIRDAVVLIKEESGAEYLLEFKNDSLPGYYYPDTSIKIKSKTNYYLTAKLKDGTIITAQTKTPALLTWKVELKGIIRYPKDTLKLPNEDSLKFSWKSDDGQYFYLIRVKCLDTLEYGIYLTPPTEEKNRRIYRPWEENVPFYNDVTRWGGPIPNTESNVVWNAIKWYGLNEVSVIAPDPNFLAWFINYQRSGKYESVLNNSVQGALGVFGSASVLSKNTFVFKNQR